MPLPLSVTTTFADASLALTATSTRPPLRLNFTALLRRFHAICWSRVGSPSTTTVGSSAATTSTPLAPAAGRTESIAASTMGASSTSSCASSRILPLTMRETSSRSSMSCAIATALRWIVSSALFCRASSNFHEVSIFAQPRIAFSGVRSSWLTTARNSSFARLARSAAWRACCSDAKRRAFSIAVAQRRASSSAKRRLDSSYVRPDSANTNVIAPRMCPPAASGTTIAVSGGRARARCAGARRRRSPSRGARPG